MDFHPFGEIFASGSSDTNLKIWDIRLKGGCIHTYKDNTRGVNAIRFTPDGRWVVSGGEDNTGKVKFVIYSLQCISGNDVDISSLNYVLFTDINIHASLQYSSNAFVMQ